MTKAYRLLALDMDGTLLDSSKRVRPQTARALEELVSRGVPLAFCTGRNPAEMGPYLADLSFVRYGVMVNGALVYDFHEQRALATRPIRTEDALGIIDAGAIEHAMPHVLAVGASVVRSEDLAHLEDFEMGVYRPLYEGYALHVDDVRDYVREHPGEVLKVNLYHLDVASRERTRGRIQSMPLTLADAETTSLESNAKGVSKAHGLEALCEHLGFSVDEVVAIGDAENDRKALEAVGMPVAMGNAAPGIKEIAHLVVADNDHDGIVEAIRTLWP